MAEPSARGLGTTLLEQAVPAGEAKLLFEPTGFIYQLQLPVSAIDTNFVEDDV